MKTQHFNGLSPAEAERLSLLMEEMGEAILAIGKIQRHGYESRHPGGGPTNREMLEREIGHIALAKDLMMRDGDISGVAVAESKMEKFNTIDRWLHHNKCGQ